MEKLVRGSVSSYVIDEQQTLIHDKLKKKLDSLPAKDVRRRLGWIPDNAAAVSTTPSKVSQQSPCFNANRKDMENNAVRGQHVISPGDGPHSPPKFPKRSSLITASMTNILNNRTYTSPKKKHSDAIRES